MGTTIMRGAKDEASKAKRAGAIALAGALAFSAAGFIAAPQALASPGQTEGANGAQAAYEDGTRIIDYQAWDSNTKTWGDSNNEDAKANDYYADGNIHLFYDTTGTQDGWDEPGGDPNDPADNVSHPNGTYVVTIPTKIAYAHMKAGAVSTKDSYTVNVRGAIAANKKVKLSAETGKALVNKSAGSDMARDITEKTEQGKTIWSAADCYGSKNGQNTLDQNADGSLIGTDATDSISMSGTARTAGEYAGTVAYTASLS